MKERIVRWVAWHLPKSIVYWCGIRVVAHATQGIYSNQEVPALTAMDAVCRFRETA